MNKTENRQNPRGSQTVYCNDDYGLENTHDVLVLAKSGQSYIKEAFDKTSTTQVTGEALKKVSAGGKGGFSSSGDAREQDKQVDVTSRVMVMSSPSQEAFNHNVSLKKVAIKFGQNEPRGDKTVGDITYSPRNTVEYRYEGETYTENVFIPSHLFGEKEIKGNVEITKTLGRDYDDFAHSGNWDPSDRQRVIEKLYAEWDTNKEFVANLGLPTAGDCPITAEMIKSSRNLYDELCGYSGAWKYLGLNGAEHRRYRIAIINTLNQDTPKTKPDPKKETRRNTTWTDEMSHARHHRGLYGFVTANYRLNNDDPEILAKWLDDHTPDHAYYVMHSLPTDSVEDWLGTIHVKEDPVRISGLSLEVMEKIQKRYKIDEVEINKMKVRENLTWNDIYKDLKGVAISETKVHSKIETKDRPSGYRTTETRLRTQTINKIKLRDESILKRYTKLQ